MAAKGKRKRRSKGRSPVNLIDVARRNLDRGDFKQALKDLRLSYRKMPTPECRCFLEHAYIGRAQQLSQNGLIEDSRRIARELMDLGVTEPSVEAGLPDLLLSVGMLDQLPEEGNGLSDQERDRLRIQAADQAVVRPGNTPKSMADLPAGAERVRAALAAVEREDGAGALGHLREIPRQSLFADWKYFVRGLIAYYAREKSDMLSNWDRLDPDRAAAKIAGPLKVMAGVMSPLEDGSLRSKVSRLEKQATDQVVLGQVMRIREAVSTHDWPKVLSTLRAVHGELRRVDAGLCDRLVLCLCGVLSHDGLVDELGRLSKVVEPPPDDPRWNRAKAVVREQSDADYPEDVIPYWRGYLCDLETLPTLSPSQRDLARGMVWQRLAGLCLQEARGLRGCDCGFDHTSEIEEAEEGAREAFGRSFALAPGFVPAYVAAAGFHLAADRPEEAAGVFRRLLEQVPDNLKALLYLGNYYLDEGDPGEARKFFERARELKPLDGDISDLVWKTHVEAACSLARSEEYDRARDELAAADRLQPARAGEFEVLARKAVLEAKAGNAGAERRFREQAQDQLIEPAPLWLAMAIEAGRYGLPRQEQWRYEKRWQDALRKRCRSETAGQMCRMLWDRWEMERLNPQHSELERCLLPYVRRCTRVKWRADDLRYVCEFLVATEELTLVEKFAKKGTRKHPQVGYFYYVIGMMEVARGPFRCDADRAVDHFEKAIELASESSDPRDRKVVENAKRAQSTLRSLQDDLEEDDADDDDFDDYDADGEEAYDYDLDELEAAGVLDKIRAACRKSGTDPQQILDEIERLQSDAARRRPIGK